MNELPSPSENEPTPPQLSRYVIETVAQSVYVEMLNCEDGFDCFSGGGPTPPVDEDELIERFLAQAMGSAAESMRKIPREDAVAQYKQAIEQAGGLEQFLNNAADRREVREQELLADFTSRQETLGHQTQEKTPSGGKLGGSAVRRLFRRS